MHSPSLFAKMDPSDLLQAVLNAVTDFSTTERFTLCKTHAPQIVECFPDWLRVAEQQGAGTPEYHSFLNKLYLISKILADNYGNGEAFAALVREGEMNTFAQWERKIEQSVELTRELRLHEASSLLTDYLIDVRELNDFGYRHMAATTHWYISQAHLHDRREQYAIAHGQRSL